MISVILFEQDETLKIDTYCPYRYDVYDRFCPG